MAGSYITFAVLGAVSILFGMFIPIIGLIAPILLLMSVFALAILIDFRIGVVLVILLTPISATTVFPHEMLGIKGLNPLNVVLLATFGSYLLKRMQHPAEYKLLPMRLVLLYLAPITLAAFLGSRHVGEIPLFLKVAGFIKFNSSIEYIRDLYVKPVLLIASALMVAAAIRESRRPEMFLIPAFIAVWLIALLVLVLIGLSGVPLSALASAGSRHFLSITGLHANELGMVFNMAYALALFMLPSTTGKVRTLVIASIIVLGASSLLTFSRAAFVAFAFVNIAFLLSQRRMRTLFAGVAIALVVAAALPQAIVERASTGIAAGDQHKISAGRVDDIWLPLLPSALKSPVIGNGLSSVMWSEPLRRGTMAAVGHTHSAYLSTLLDFGLLGCGLIFSFFWLLWKEFRRLSREDSSKIFRGYFGGASICVVILLLQGVSDDKFVPTNSQVLLWLSMGILIGRGGLFSQVGKATVKA